MVKHFLTLEWKQFLRSSYFQKGIAIKILLALAALYFGGAAIMLGAGMFFIISEVVPNEDPITIVNNYIILWFLFDMVLRFFMQQLPVMNVKPLMVIPIKRHTVIHYLLGKTTLSFFNFIPVFIFLPFCIVLLVKGYATVNVISWFFSIIFLTLAVNYINFLINKNNTVFYVLIALIAILVGLQYYDVYDLFQPMGNAFNALYKYPFLVLASLFLASVMYFINFNYIKKGFYLDDAVSKKVQKVSATDLSWMDRFGKLAVFLKNDVKMIVRNARPKQVLMMSFLFLFYGLIFYTQDTYRDMPVFLAFASIFVTGGFLMTFGQHVPSWDSEYYKLLMSQNIPYRKYLESKWYLMVVGVVVSFILSTPYIYFGWKIYSMIAAGALFNVGLNSFITLFGGALNRVPIELNVKAKAFSNTNGFNPTQLLIGLPKMILPMVLFYIPYKLINFETGIIVLALFGAMGIIFKSFFLSKIESVYQKGKYKTVAAYAEKA